MGVTRAKRRLYLSGAHWYTEKRPKLMSVVMEAALALPRATIGTMVDEPGAAPGQLRLETPAGSPDPLFDSGWQAALRAGVDDPESIMRMAPDRDAYDMAMEQTELTLDSLPRPPTTETESDSPTTSVTGLVTLAGCPQRFYWSDVDPLPRRSTRAMRRGVEVHRMIELHALGHIPLWDLADDLYDAVTHDMPAESSKPFDTFKASRYAQRRALFVEVPMDLAFDNGRVRGRIDAVYEDEPGQWEIVDWKSGTISSDPTRVIQLQAYALAAHAGLIGDRVPDSLRVTFCYLGGPEAETVSYDVTADWLEEAQAAIETALESVAGPEYPPAPGTRCHSCDFTRFCDAGTAWLADHK